MKRGMTHAARAELADAIRSRYSAAAGKDKHKILHEFIAVTGHHEKSAIRILNGPVAVKLRKTRQRTPLYDEAARAALIVMWEASDRVCGKRLKALLPILLPALERNGHLNLHQEIRSKVLSNGAIVRKLLDYRRFEGLAAARVITRLYGASRLFVNFFQPSFKLAEKHRDGAKVTKRYHPPLTPCERLLQSDCIPDVAKAKLREVSAELDPLKLLEEVRAVQAHLAALADGEMPPAMTTEPPNLAAFVASLSSAWHAGEIRPTFSMEAKPRYLRSLQRVSAQTLASGGATPPKQATPSAPAPESAVAPERPKLIYAQSGNARIQALRTVWPIVFRRLEALPNINAMQLFEELCFQFPGRFTFRQYRTLLRRVNRWRQDARARGVVIGSKTYRRISDKPRGRRADIFKDHWQEMVHRLEECPDQTALELLVEFQVRYPGRYSLRQLYTLQKRVRIWRQQAVQRLIAEVGSQTRNVSSAASPMEVG